MQSLSFWSAKGLFFDPREREPVISTSRENRALEHIFHLVLGGTEAGPKEELEILRQQKRSWSPFPRWPSRGTAQRWDEERGNSPKRDVVGREGSELGLLALTLQGGRPGRVESPDS